MGNQTKKTNVELLQEIKDLKTQITELENKKINFSNESSYSFSSVKIIHSNWDLKNRTIKWSSIAEEILGFTNGSFGNTIESFYQNIHPEDRQNFTNNLSHNINNQSKECHTEFRMIRDNKQVIWITANGKIDYDTNGNPLNIHAILLDITKRKLTEQKLEDQTNFLTLLLNHMPNQIFWKDKKLSYLGCNRKFSEAIGLNNPEDVIGKSDSDFYPSPEQTNRHWEEDRNVITNEKPILNTEEVYQNFKGENAWISTSKIPLYHYKEVIGLLGITTDITQSKNIEKEHIATRLRYETMFNDSPIPLWEEDFTELIDYIDSLKLEGVHDFREFFDKNPEALLLCSQKVKATDVNRATLQLHQAKSKEELLGNLDKIFTNKSFEVFKEEVIAISEGKNKFEIEGEIKTLHGEPRQILLKLFIDESYTKSAKALLATIDITEKKKAEEALKVSENKFRLSFEATNVGMVISNHAGSLVSVNNAMCNILGYSKEELQTKTFLDITHPDDLVKSKKQFNKSITSAISFTLEKRYLNKNNQIKWGLTSVSPIYNSNGDFMYAIGHIQDITNKKQTEEQILTHNKEFERLNKEYKSQNEELVKTIAIAAKSDQLKSEFLQNLSHEIRTPMNAILGFSDFLELQKTTPEKRQQYINIIKSSGNQLLRIIDDILEISALETKHVQVVNKSFNLNNLLTELFTIFQPKAREKGIALYIKKGLTDRETNIISDESKLSKIFTNLLENAIKYTPNGFIEIGYKLVKDELKFYVKDTGLGISKTRQGQIFERFSQGESEISKKIGGLGLGLSIVKENIELLGGNIKLESNIGKGSTFLLTIPFKSDGSDSTQNEKNTKVRKHKILIAEDEEINYFYFETLLEEIAPNCKLIHAKNGKEALEICKKEDFELIFMDIKMPEMNGYEATIEIKKIKPNSTIIAQTSYSTKEDKERARLAGCEDFLSKPISLETMQSILNKYIYL
ncbi:MAG: PAS domain S-box protein [Labilibaculum sp.]|nr:PAS domain S-box protein [Labilibaculum sp.]MBI9058207.1 PAS domain S-box protein [Labilibaculum sp.]